MNFWSLFINDKMPLAIVVFTIMKSVEVYLVASRSWTGVKIEIKHEVYCL